MKKIVLLCAAGMSTSLIVNKMKVAAKEANYECEINAYPIAEADTVGKDADVILLGPQVRFDLDKVKKKLPEKIVAAIDMRSYGLVNGKKILEDARKLMGD